MANQTITQLPTAQALTGTELVPIVQDGGTVKTTVADIAATPVTNYSFVTATSEGSLSQSRQLSTSGNGLTLTDNGAGSTLVLSLSGAAASLVAAGTGIQVKTGATTLTARSIAAGTAGLSIADGDGIAGNPTVSLSGLVLNLAQTSGVGLLTRTSGSSIGVVTLTGTASEIDVTNGTGDGANPTIGLADDPILPGTGGMIFPKGTTVERLSPAVEGAFRYNTQTGVFEGYTGAGWGAIVTGSGVASFSAGTTGFTPSSPSSGAIVLGGTLITSNGGTGLASYTAGDTLYYATGTALSKLAIGAASRIMTSSGSAPQWTDPATITVGTATSATTATNLAGGAAGSLPYQTGAGATTFLGIGTATQILKVNAGATSLEYADQSTLAVGTATNLAGGAANRIPYQTGAGATSFLVAPTTANRFLKWDGSAFSWDVAGVGTVTSVDVSGGTTGLTTSGGPITSSGTITIAGTLAVANGGTGITGTPANGQLLIGNGAGYTLGTLTQGANITITNAAGAITIAASGGNVSGSNIFLSNNFGGM